MTPNIKLGKSPLELAHIPCPKNEGIWRYIKKKVLKADKFVFSRNLPIELAEGYMLILRGSQRISERQDHKVITELCEVVRVKL